LAQGDYLRALSIARDAADDSVPISFINDALVYLLQAVGRFADADVVRDHRTQLEQQRGLEALPPQLQQAMREAAEREKTLTTLAAPQAIDLEQAPAALASAVRQYRVVVLGELHYHPEHRAFGARVLAQLRSAGVTHLALETGNQFTLDQAHREVRIRTTTDPFSFEPQRAALLRAALRLELPIVAFDTDSNDGEWLLNHPDMQFRERRMAEHIAERVLQPEPAAHVLVWVGHQHGQKFQHGLKMMAMHLWEITAEEPFSAYQLTGAGNYRGVDLVIRHPESRYEHGRPDWLRINRHSVQGVVEPPGEYLLQLQPAAEGTASTPADQLLTEEDGQFELLVPAGDYLLRVWSAAGHVSEPRPLAVRGDLDDLRIQA
jgi:hypothetical protein